jgi:hypothetical protein
MSNIFNFDILNTPTSKIKKKTLIIFFILYVTLIVISSIVYGYLLNKNLNLYDENFNLIFENIPFSNGEIISNLKNFNEYFTEYLGLGIKFYLQKTPAIPLLIYSISLISENFFFILILKNLIFYSLYFFISYLTIRSINKKYLFFIIVSIVPIIIPYNFTVSLNFVYEDCLTALILPSVFLLLITDYKKKYLLLGLLFFILYFVKTSVFFIILIVPLLMIFLENKSLKKYLPLFFSIFAILIWGSFGLIKTGKFPILSTSSSVNSHVMGFALNKNFHKYYPNKSTDLIPINHNIPKNIYNEWEFYDFFDKKNKKYLNENFDRFIKDAFIKINFIFFGIKRDNALPDISGDFNNEIRISQVISKIILNVSIFVMILKIFSGFKIFFNSKINIFFIAIIVLSLIPHIMVWASSKHLIGIINISFIYLLFFIDDHKKIKHLIRF